MSDRLSQAYLFICPDRLTAKYMLLAISKLLACNTKSACEVCDGCMKANAGSHPDILVYPKNKSFVVEDAGNIYDSVQIKPMYAKNKIYVINDLDNSTEQAQNKMLKIIEEPPANVVFLMSASNENKILKTIHSRVQKIYINRINKSLLDGIINAKEDVKQIAISNGDGYLGKTLEIANNLEFIKIYKNAQKILFNLKNSSKVPEFSGFLAENKLNFENYLYILSDFFRDILMLKINQKKLIKNINLINDYSQVQEEYSILSLNEILKNLNLFKKKLDANVNLTSLADGLLLNILEVKFLCK